MALQGLVLFKIDDEEWTLDLRSGKGKVSKGGAGSDKPDLTLTISDENFVKLVMGKIGPQQVQPLQHLGHPICHARLHVTSACIHQQHAGFSHGLLMFF